MEQFDDISLVAQVAVFHNKRAFDRLVKKYQSPVRRFFLHQTLGDSELSDDLAQETFIKAYLNITKFRGLSGFSTWLFRIAYNVFYDGAILPTTSKVSTGVPTPKEQLLRASPPTTRYA